MATRLFVTGVPLGTAVSKLLEPLKVRVIKSELDRGGKSACATIDLESDGGQAAKTVQELNARFRSKGIKFEFDTKPASAQFIATRSQSASRPVSSPARALSPPLPEKAPLPIANSKRVEPSPDQVRQPSAPPAAIARPPEIIPSSNRAESTPASFANQAEQSPISAKQATTVVESGGQKTNTSLVREVDLPVYLCGRESIKTPCDSPVSGKVCLPVTGVEILRNVSSTLITPLAVPVEDLASLQEEQGEIDVIRLRRNVEYIARFFLWVVYSVIKKQYVGIPDDVARLLSGSRKDCRGQNMLRAMAGTAINFVTNLIHDIDQSQVAPFVKRGIDWWEDAHEALLGITSRCGAAGHLTSHGFRTEIQPALLRMNVELAKLQELNWTMVSESEGTEEVTVFQGASDQTWRSLTESIPSEALPVAPFLRFLPSEKRLCIFQGTDWDAVLHRKVCVFAKFGECSEEKHRPPEKWISTEATKQISREIPTERWRSHFTDLDEWRKYTEAQRADYRFGDKIEKLHPSRFYERERDLQGLECRVQESRRQGLAALVIEGAEGVGKSALMSHLAERLESNEKPISSYFMPNKEYPSVKVLENNTKCVPYYFIRDDDHPRCRLDGLLEAVAFSVADFLGVPLKRQQSPSEAFYEAAGKTRLVLQQNSTAAPFVLIVDGVDALNEQEFTRLLTFIDVTKGTPFLWVLSSRPSDALNSFVKNACSKVERFPLGPLDRESARRFLLGEIDAFSRGSDQDQRSLFSQDWVEQVLQSPDFGLPLFLHEAISSPKDPSRSIKARWDRDIHDNNWLMKNVLALLAVAFGPLSAKDIAEILRGGLSAEEVEKGLSDQSPHLERVGAGWRIRDVRFRDHIRQSSQVLQERCRSFDALMTWVAKWRKASSPYPVEFLAKHLEDSESREKHDELRALAKDQEFLELQQDRFPDRPDIPLETIYGALRVTCKECEVDQVPEVFTLALRHAEFVARMSRVGRLSEELVNSNYAYVAQLAGLLEEEQEQLLWKLLAAASALAAGDSEAARLISAQVHSAKRGRGSQHFYEDIAAVLLGTLASLATQSDVDLESAIREAAAGMIGSRGRLRLFESLGPASGNLRLTSLLPTAANTRWRAIKNLAYSRGRHCDSDEMVSLARECAQQAGGRTDQECLKRADEMRVEGAAGCSAARDFDGAMQVALRIQAPYPRRQALCNIGVELALAGRPLGEIGRSLRVAKAFWKYAPSNAIVVQPCREETLADICHLLHELAENAEFIRHPIPMIVIVSLLSVMQEKLVPGDGSLLQRTAKLISEVQDPKQADHARSSLLHTYVCLRRWEDARCVAESIVQERERRRALVDLQAWEIAAVSGDIDPTIGQRLGTSTACSVASSVCRAGQANKALEMVHRLLVSLRSLKAEHPAYWGKPRILGEIAAVLHSIGQAEAADQYFYHAGRNLDRLKPPWELDRAFGLINLAEARLSAEGCDVIKADNLLREAWVVASRSSLLRERPAMLAEILAEVWAIMCTYEMEGPDEVLDRAFKIARGSKPSQQVKGLVEIARRQARLGCVQKAKETLLEAQSTAEKGNVMDQATVFLGRGLCGLNGDLEKGIEACKMIFEGDARSVACRADVELRLSNSGITEAEQALDEIDNVEVRSHAARSVARKYASTGLYTEALRIVEKIGARRGELVPDVAEEVASHVRMNQSSRVVARHVLLRLLLESVRHLDGTYRTIAAILRSRAFEFDPETLQTLVQVLGLKYDPLSKEAV